MKQEKIIVGFKEVGKEIKFIQIENHYKELQKLVGGYIQVLPTGIDGLAIYINDEGKLDGLMPHLYLGETDVICGNVVFVRADDEGCDIDLNQRDMIFLKQTLPKIEISKEAAKDILNNIDDFIGFEFRTFGDDDEK